MNELEGREMKDEIEEIEKGIGNKERKVVEIVGGEKV